MKFTQNKAKYFWEKYKWKIVLFKLCSYFFLPMTKPQKCSSHTDLFITCF